MQENMHAHARLIADLQPCHNATMPPCWGLHAQQMGHEQACLPCSPMSWLVQSARHTQHATWQEAL